MIRVVAILLVFFLSIVKAETILGVSPALIDLGTLKPGEKRLVTFYVVSPTNEKVLVSLSSVDGDISFYSRAEYKDKIYNASEEKTSSWVEFLKNPVELQPVEEEIRLKRGLIVGAREINFIVSVPESSDPGYHVVKVRPIPITSEQPLTGGIGINVVTTADFLVVFNVEGNAFRSGKIVDLILDSYDGRFLEGRVLFKNTGTVTLRTTLENIKVENETKIINLQELVRPGEMKALRFIIEKPGLEEGKNYFFDVYTSFSTGNDSAKIEAKIPKITARIVAKSEKKFPNIFVYLISAIIIVALIIIFYRRKNES